MKTLRDWTVVSWYWDEYVPMPDGRTGLRQTPGAAITDNDTGIEYRATVASGRGGPQITHLEITPARGYVGNALLSRIPAAEIAKAVEANVRERERSGVDFVLDTAPSRPARTPMSMPDPEDFAREHARHTREGLADFYDVSASTIDRWVARIRRQRPELLPPAKRGRPSNQQTADATNAPVRKGRKANNTAKKEN